MSELNNIVRSIIVQASMQPIARNLLQNSIERIHVGSRQRIRSRNHTLIDFKEKRNSLVNKLLHKIENEGSSPNLEALLQQLLIAPDIKLNNFEEVINELCEPRMINIQRPLIINHAPPNILDIFQLLSFDDRQATESSNKPEIKEEEKKICVTFKDLKRAAEDNKCVICLEKYNDNDNIEIRHCGHTFHKECLTLWESSGRTNGKLCPCCRH